MTSFFREREINNKVRLSFKLSVYIKKDMAQSDSGES